MSATFRSLKVRNFRLFAAGQVVSVTGTWAQRIAQDWLVLSVADDPGVALGVVTMLQFLPMLLFGLFGGVLADRYDKRRLLMGSQAAMALLALALGLLDLTGHISLWHVYVLAACLGMVGVVDTPARQALVGELVAPQDLPNAVSLNSATFNGARILGPALAGLAIAQTGTAWVFLANALSYVAVLIGLARISVPDLRTTTRLPRAKRQLREGIAHVRQRPALVVTMLLALIVGTFGMSFQITLALIAVQTFEKGAGSFGLLSSAVAVGALLGALTSARRREAPTIRRVLVAGLAFGLLEVIAGTASTFWTMALLLVPMGYALLTFTTTANSLVQLGSAPSFRGRIIALYALVFLGGTPLGAVLTGVLAERAGPRSSLLVGGILVTVSALAAAALYRKLARRQRAEQDVDEEAWITSPPSSLAAV